MIRALRLDPHMSPDSKNKSVKSPALLRARQLLGKYRLEKKLAVGGFAVVFQAMDTIEGIRVALKIPYPTLIDDDVLKDFRSEVRLTARMDHQNILPLKNASFINDYFVIVTPLGSETLGDRLRRRMATRTALELGEQMVEATAYAHRLRIAHCDLKPENMILFANARLRLADFGIAKVAQKTLRASGSGTLGYMAPEQAMGRPSLRSDVFSLGLILYRMFSGELPEWPFSWPPPGIGKLRRRVHRDMVSVLKKSLDLDPRKRYRDAVKLLEAYGPARARTLRQIARRRTG